MREKRRWKKGENGWIIYKYVDGMRGTVVPVEVIESQDRRGYLSVSVPGLFGSTFGCLVTAGHMHETEESAKAVWETLPKFHNFTPK